MEQPKRVEARATEAWTQRQERGPSYGSHPLSEVLEEHSSDSQPDVRAQLTFPSSGTVGGSDLSGSFDVIDHYPSLIGVEGEAPEREQ